MTEPSVRLSMKLSVMTGWWVLIDGGGVILHSGLISPKESLVMPLVNLSCNFAAVSGITAVRAFLMYSSRLRTLRSIGFPKQCRGNCIAMAVRFM